MKIKTTTRRANIQFHTTEALGVQAAGTAVTVVDLRK